jgi:hypothetical protein
MAIVQVNVSQTIAPIPSQLQKTGALISQGATTLAANAKQIIRAPGDITALLQAPVANVSLAWASSVVTATTTTPHKIPVGDTVPVTIAGATPAGFNGTFMGTATSTTVFTYPLVANPGANTAPGTFVLGDVAELVAMVNTFYAQGSQQAVWVLELGAGDAAAGVAALDTYIDANTVRGNGPFYSYLVPKLWADETTFVTFAGTFTDLTARTYFWTTTSLSNYDDFANLKSIVAMVPSPTAPASEFSHAADYYVPLNYKPSAANKVTPFAYTYLFGVTDYPQPGNTNVIADLEDAFVNYVGTGAEGGLSNKVLYNGTTMDGRDFTYWYSVDWAQINVAQAVAAAVISGSNTPQNPLYYNQDGIDRLQGVIAATLAQGVSFGLVFGAPVQVAMAPADFVTAVENGDFAGRTAINAQPFPSYSVANPNDYAVGLYTGFQYAYTPNRGFKHIIINMNVTDFVTA